MVERDMEQLSIKVPKGLVAIIDDDISLTEEFRNRSEFIVMAIRYYADHRAVIIKTRNENRVGIKDP
ncbi:MAG: ribbon-helix-helix domain-containing protein [Methanomassiliicoccaceae archaeon]|nr:ribbon-helix-helix domain-containing protein [Methanomassiliicoccaceae archaeon]